MSNQDTSLSLYPWQANAVERVIVGNVIVQVPTGGGKTLIAVKAIDHFLATFPAKRVLFVVPTRPLVEQQAAYCVTNCQSRPRVARVETPRASLRRSGRLRLSRGDESLDPLPALRPRGGRARAR